MPCRLDMQCSLYVIKLYYDYAFPSYLPDKRVGRTGGRCTSLVGHRLFGIFCNQCRDGSRLGKDGRQARQKAHGVESQHTPRSQLFSRRYRHRPDTTYIDAHVSRLRCRSLADGAGYYDLLCSAAEARRLSRCYARLPYGRQCHRASLRRRLSGDFRYAHVLLSGGRRSFYQFPHAFYLY